MKPTIKQLVTVSNCIGAYHIIREYKEPIMTCYLLYQYPLYTCGGYLLKKYVGK